VVTELEMPEVGEMVTTAPVQIIQVTVADLIQQVAVELLLLPILAIMLL
jgi:hypothetical protein